MVALSHAVAGNDVPACDRTCYGFPDCLPGRRNIWQRAGVALIGHFSLFESFCRLLLLACSNWPNWRPRYDPKRIPALLRSRIIGLRCRQQTDKSAAAAANSGRPLLSGSHSAASTRFERGRKVTNCSSATNHVADDISPSKAGQLVPQCKWCAIHENTFTVSRSTSWL